MARLMALDVGEVRIGVALSDASGFLASPYTTLRVTRDESETWATLQHLIDETQAEELVIGLPISLNGEIHAQAQRIMAFAERLQAQIKLPVTFWDERLSTVEAERLLAEKEQNSHARRHQGNNRRGREQSRRRRKKRMQHEIDALAAAVILQEYLDQHPTRRETLPDQTEDEA